MDEFPMEPDAASADDPGVGPGDPAGPAPAGDGGALEREGERTVAVTDAIVSVYRDLQNAAEKPGPHAHFLAWASANPTQYYNLFIKLLSREAGAEVCTRTVVGALVFKGVND